MHALTYRDDARDTKGLVKILEDVAQHKNIRFSGRDEGLSAQHWRISAQILSMDPRNLDHPDAWRAYKVIHDIFRDLDPKVKQIKADAETIEDLLRGYGYERLTISNDQNTAHLYVRHLGLYIDVLMDHDPYTRKWKFDYHEVARENFKGWCDHVLDEDNTLYRRMMDRAYRVCKSLGDSLIGMTVSVGIGAIPAITFTLMGDPILAQGIMFAIIGIRGIRTVAESYHQTRLEPQLTFARTRVIDGREALVYAIDDTRK